jgi:ATP-dependent DNA helicase RecG
MTLMTQNPAITYKELAASINKSTSTVKRHIQELKASGAISRIGGAKGGRWEVRQGYKPTI